MSMQKIVVSICLIICLILNNNSLSSVLAAENSEKCCQTKQDIENAATNRICNLFSNLKDCNNIPSCNYVCNDPSIVATGFFVCLCVFCFCFFCRLLALLLFCNFRQYNSHCTHKQHPPFTHTHTHTQIKSQKPNKKIKIK